MTVAHCHSSTLVPRTCAHVLSQSFIGSPLKRHQEISSVRTTVNNIRLLLRTSQKLHFLKCFPPLQARYYRLLTYFGT